MGACHNNCQSVVEKITESFDPPVANVDDDSHWAQPQLFINAQPANAIPPELVPDASLRTPQVGNGPQLVAAPQPVLEERHPAAITVDLDRPDVDINAPLDDRDIDLVQQTFARATMLGYENIGWVLFMNIFEIAPHVKGLFPFGDEEDVARSSRMKLHAGKVVSVVARAVSLLRDHDELVSVLQSLGLRHIGYGVLPEHYDVVGQALIKALGTSLGPKMTTAVTNSYLKVFAIIQNTMLQECGHTSSSVSVARTPVIDSVRTHQTNTLDSGAVPSAVSVTSVHTAAATNSESSQPFLADPAVQPQSACERPTAATAIDLYQPAVDVETPLEDRDIDLVQHTFGMATMLGYENLGWVLFMNIFEIEPDAQQLFPFRDELDIARSSRMKGHAGRVISLLATAVSLLRDQVGLETVLQSLGLRHAGYGVLPQHYDVVGQALIKSLSTSLGPKMTPAVTNSYIKVFTLVKHTMTEKCAYTMPTEHIEPAVAASMMDTHPGASEIWSECTDLMNAEPAVDSQPPSDDSRESSSPPVPVQAADSQPVAIELWPGCVETLLESLHAASEKSADHVEPPLAASMSSSHPVTDREHPVAIIDAPIASAAIDSQPVRIQKPENYDAIVATPAIDFQTNVVGDLPGLVDPVYACVGQDSDPAVEQALPVACTPVAPAAIDSQPVVVCYVLDSADSALPTVMPDSQPLTIQEQSQFAGAAVAACLIDSQTLVVEESSLPSPAEDCQQHAIEKLPVLNDQLLAAVGTDSDPLDLQVPAVSVDTPITPFLIDSQPLMVKKSSEDADPSVASCAIKSEPHAVDNFPVSVDPLPASFQKDSQPVAVQALAESVDKLVAPSEIDSHHVVCEKFSGSADLVVPVAMKDFQVLAADLSHSADAPVVASVLDSQPVVIEHSPEGADPSAIDSQKHASEKLPLWDDPLLAAVGRSSDPVDLQAPAVSADTPVTPTAIDSQPAVGEKPPEFAASAFPAGVPGSHSSAIEELPHSTHARAAASVINSQPPVHDASSPSSHAGDNQPHAIEKLPVSDDPLLAAVGKDSDPVDLQAPATSVDTPVAPAAIESHPVAGETPSELTVSALPAGVKDDPSVAVANLSHSVDATVAASAIDSHPATDDWIAVFPDPLVTEPCVDYQYSASEKSSACVDPSVAALAFNSQPVANANSLVSFDQPTAGPVIDSNGGVVEQSTESAEFTMAPSVMEPQTVANVNAQPEALPVIVDTNERGELDGIAVTSSDGLIMGRGSWAIAYRQAAGNRRWAFQLLCTTGIVTARELSDDLTVISEEHIEECVQIATEMLQTQELEIWASQPQEAKMFFEARLTARLKARLAIFSDA